MAKQITRKRILGLAALATLLSSCGTDRRNFEELSAKPAPKGHAVAAARFLSACPTSVGALTSITPAAPHTVSGAPSQGDSRSAIITSLTGFAIDAAVGAVQIELEKAKSRLNGSFLAMGAQVGGQERVLNRTGTVRRNGGCLVIYQGLGGASENTSLGDGLDLSILSALGLSGQPAFYLELAANVQNKTRVLSVNHLQYAATSAMRPGSGHKTVTLAVGLGAVGKTAEDPKTAPEVYLFNLGQLEVGNSYPGNPGQVAVAPLKAKGTFNIVALVSESEDPSVALEAMTKAFSANKDSLATAFKDALK